MIFRSLLHSAFVQILVHNFGVVLGQIARVGGGEAKDRFSALVNDIDAQDHGVKVLYLLTDVDSVQVELSFSIHLTKNVCVDTVDWSISGKFPIQKELSDELRDNSLLVKVLLDLWLAILLLDKDKSLLAILYIG